MGVYGFKMKVESKVELLLFSLQAHTMSCIVQLEVTIMVTLAIAVITNRYKL